MHSEYMATEASDPFYKHYNQFNTNLITKAEDWTKQNL